MIGQAIGTTGSPAQYLIAQKYLESLGQIATDADKLVFLPYEASGILVVARRHQGVVDGNRTSPQVAIGRQPWLDERHGREGPVRPF